MWSNNILIIQNNVARCLLSPLLKFIYLKGSMTAKKARNLLSYDSLLQCPQQLGLGYAKVRSHDWAFHMDDWDPSALGPSSTTSQAHWQEAGLKAEVGTSSQALQYGV